MTETEMDVLLDGLAFYIARHDDTDEKWISCTDPFVIWSCPWDTWLLAEMAR